MRKLERQQAAGPCRPAGRRAGTVRARAGVHDLRDTAGKAQRGRVLTRAERAKRRGLASCTCAHHVQGGLSSPAARAHIRAGSVVAADEEGLDSEDPVKEEGGGILRAKLFSEVHRGARSRDRRRSARYSMAD